MSQFAVIVDWDALGQTVLAAILAGVGVAVTVSLGILGSVKLSDSSRSLGLIGTIGYGTLAVAGIGGTIAAIVFGLIVMI